MKPFSFAAKTPALVLLCGSFLLGACASKRDGRLVNTRQPGPALGTGVGMAAGAVAGNVSGAVVGAGEGFAGAAGSAFNGDRRVVRSWRTEVTPDGRTVRVPVELEVDAHGRPYPEPGSGGAGGDDEDGAPTMRGPRAR